MILMCSLEENGKKLVKTRVNAYVHAGFHLQCLKSVKLYNLRMVLGSNHEKWFQNTKNNLFSSLINISADFRVRLSMLPVATSFGARFSCICPSCRNALDTAPHFLVCPAYGCLELAQRIQHRIVFNKK